MRESIRQNLQKALAETVAKTEEIQARPIPGRTASPGQTANAQMLLTEGMDPKGPESGSPVAVGSGSRAVMAMAARDGGGQSADGRPPRPAGKEGRRSRSRGKGVGKGHISGYGAMLSGGGGAAGSGRPAWGDWAVWRRADNQA